MASTQASVHRLPMQGEAPFTPSAGGPRAVSVALTLLRPLSMSHGVRFILCTGLVVLLLAYTLELSFIVGITPARDTAVLSNGARDGRPLICHRCVLLPLSLHSGMVERIPVPVEAFRSGLNPGFAIEFLMSFIVSLLVVLSAGLTVLAIGV
eukprot:SM000042S15297  [mRNA]  locus=s42:274654:275793:+ [translate_table: standard]